MGFILIPLITFWFVMALYSLKVGYVLLTSTPVQSYSIAVSAIALLSTTFYLILGFYGFKGAKALGAFDITLFFTANTLTVIIFLAAMVVHYFFSEHLTHEYLKPLPFIIIFTISIGAIVGAFGSDYFIEKLGIPKTY